MRVHVTGKGSREFEVFRGTGFTYDAPRGPFVFGGRVIHADTTAEAYQRASSALGANTPFVLREITNG